MGAVSFLEQFFPELEASDQNHHHAVRHRRPSRPSGRRQRRLSLQGLRIQGEIDASCENNHIAPACPLVVGGEHAYTIELPVSSWYPSLRLNVKWQLQDENKNDLVCIIFPAMLK